MLDFPICGNKLYLSTFGSTYTSEQMYSHVKPVLMTQDMNVCAFRSSREDARGQCTPAIIELDQERQGKRRVNLVMN